MIDTGFDYFAAFDEGILWTNAFEAEIRSSNGLDDDDNGYIDDWAGWDWVGNDNDSFDWPETGPSAGVPVKLGAEMPPMASHGTAMLDIVISTLEGLVPEAEGEQPWRERVRFQNLRVAGGIESVVSGDIGSAVDYAMQSGAEIVILGLSVVNPSFDVTPILESMASAPETVFLVPAGNRGVDLDREGGGLCQGQKNVICVAAVDSRTDAASDLRISSSFGVRTVAVAADGGKATVSQPRVHSTWSWDETEHRSERPKEPEILGHVLLRPGRSGHQSCNLYGVFERPRVTSGAERIEVVDDTERVLASLETSLAEELALGTGPARFSSSFKVADQTALRVRRSGNQIEGNLREAALICAGTSQHGDASELPMSGSSVATARVGAHLVAIALRATNLTGPDLRNKALEQSERVPELAEFVAFGRFLKEDPPPLARTTIDGRSVCEK